MKVNYEDKIIAYIDILGFKQYIEETTSKGNQEDLFKILFRFKEIAKAQPLKRPDRQSIHFSDLIIITCPISKSAVDDLISDLAELVFSFIDSNLLLRGIVTKGKIIHQNGIIFGPGLIDAYYLEKDKVIFPRILINKDIVSEFKFEKHKVSTEYKGRERHLMVDVDSFDGEYFINYFPSYMTFPKKDKIFDEKFFDIISSGLLNENNRVKDKYQWMATWHDHYLKEFIKKTEMELKNKHALESQKIDTMKSQFLINSFDN